MEQRLIGMTPDEVKAVLGTYNEAITWSSHETVLYYMPTDRYVLPRGWLGIRIKPDVHQFAVEVRDGIVAGCHIKGRSGFVAF